MVHQASRLGDVVAQACLSIARMVRVVEKTHNSKTMEALLVRQHLEKVSAKAIDSVMDEIQGAHPSRYVAGRKEDLCLYFL